MYTYIKQTEMFMTWKSIIAILMFQGHCEACAVVQKWVGNPHLHVRKIHNYHIDEDVYLI